MAQYSDSWLGPPEFVSYVAMSNRGQGHALQDGPIYLDMWIDTWLYTVVDISVRIDFTH